MSINSIWGDNVKRVYFDALKDNKNTDLLCDLVRGKSSPYAAIFDPSRSLLCPQLAVNAFESTVGLLTPTVPRCPHLGCALKYNRA